MLISAMVGIDLRNTLDMDATIRGFNLTKGIANTRARDYYDLYILKKFQKKNINNGILRKAIINKFQERQTNRYLEKVDIQIKDIENSNELKEIWKNYQNKFSYAQDINFEDTIITIKEIANLLN